MKNNSQKHVPVWYSVVGMCLKTKSRYSLLDRSFFAKIYLAVLKLFPPNFASFIRLSVSNLYKLRIRVNICANVTIISTTLCNGFLVFRFENLTHNLLFVFFPFFIALYSPWIRHWASLNSSKFEFFPSRSSVLRYHISVSSLDDFKAISMFCILNVEMVMNWNPPYSVFIYPYVLP